MFDRIMSACLIALAIAASIVSADCMSQLSAVKTLTPGALSTSLIARK